MKKIKVMLSAIVVLAVVGGALAFKAKGEEVYCSSEPKASNCPILDDYTFHPTGNVVSYCTDGANLPCTQTSLITFAP